MSMSAGKLNRRIRIEKRVAGADALNQPLDAWELHADAWAHIRGETGMGSIRAQESGVVKDIKKYSFRVRYRTDVLDVGMRIVFAGEVYDIKQVRQDHADQQWTDIVAETGGNDG